MGMISKAVLQEENEALKREIEQYKQANNRLQSDVQIYKKEEKGYKDRIESLNMAVNGLKKELDDAKKQTAECKNELDNLADTKTVLNSLMSILRNPHNDYQKVVNELNDMLRQERSRADALEQELCNIQFDIQQNRFLDGKVQAYEAMLMANSPYCPPRRCEDDTNSA